MSTESIATWALVVAIISAAVSFYSAYENRRDRILQPKRDVLRRYIGNLHRISENLIGESRDGSEPFIALNEARAVFGKDKDVQRALRELWGSRSNQAEKHIEIVRAMAKASNLDLSMWSDEFLLRPFSPRNVPES